MATEPNGQRATSWPFISTDPRVNPRIQHELDAPPASRTPPTSPGIQRATALPTDLNR